MAEVRLVCASHTPLLTLNDPGTEIRTEATHAQQALAQYAAAFDPELVIIFGPDHFNGFFWDNMPSFCVGAAVNSTGDYGTPAGPLRVPEKLAADCARFAHAHGVDAALSYRMTIDHGFTQTLTQLFGSLQRVETIPIFVNCAAMPMPPLMRVRALGAALGRFVATLDRSRVLIVGSGGLSHDPPTPQIDAADPQVRERLIDGRADLLRMRPIREERVRQAGLDFIQGKGPCRPLNPDWDESVMALLAGGRFDTLCEWSDEFIDAQGGRGGHEIRTWVAAFAALHELGACQVDYRYYRAIPAWIAGMGMVAARALPNAGAGRASH
ncbi:MAG: 3-carboxyethylcatechol 2,3-dioxygenase [Burkholderiaceae bacterium]